MRRKDREVTAIADLLAIIDRCRVCRLGLCDDGRAYIVPMNFGYSLENGALTLYFHSAREGKKIDIIRKNNKACFELDCDHKLLSGDQACEYSFAYSSIIGFGSIEFIDAEQEKINALEILMKHQTGKEAQPDTLNSFIICKEAVDSVTVFKLAADSFSGKCRTAAK